jgi:peptidyl-dipeptidase A
VSKQSLISSPFHRLSLSLSKQFNEHLKNSTDEELKRIFNKLAQGAVSTDDEYLKKTSELHSKLDRIYSTTKVCELNNTSQCYTLTPYLEQLMQTEKDYDRLLWAWKGWYDQCGNQIRPVYLTYIDLINKNIKQNGFKDLAVNNLFDRIRYFSFISLF